VIAFSLLSSVSGLSHSQEKSQGSPWDFSSYCPLYLKGEPLIMTMLAFVDCCEMLSIDPKTLRHWLRQADIALQPHPSDARVKCLTLAQVQSLAARHSRTLKSQPVLPSGTGTSTPASEEPKPSPSPAPSPEADLSQKLAVLEAQVSLLSQQLAQLTLMLLGQQTSVGHPGVPLPALMPATGPQQPCSAVLAQQEEMVQAEAGPRPHPAESRRRRLIPLIEYGATGSYVVICPQQGELHLRPDSPEWFAWLASVLSFRFVGKGGRFTACRVYDHKGPSRSWQAHRVIHQRHYKPYLGVTECLTIDRLEQAAAILQSYVNPR
jgi:hypothetical protein